MKKSGVSTVVATIILIALVMAITAIVWSVIQRMVEGELGGAKACFGNYEKVTINNQYTCYEKDDDELFISISVKDIEIDKIIVGVNSAMNSKVFEIPGKDVNVKTYESAYGYNEQLSAINENEGKTFVMKGVTEAPDKIEIIPVIDGTQCEVSDSVFEIDSCTSLP